jgi:hypothetical protein
LLAIFIGAHLLIKIFPNGVMMFVVDRLPFLTSLTPTLIHHGMKGTNQILEPVLINPTLSIEISSASLARKFTRY